MHMYVCSPWFSILQLYKSMLLLILFCVFNVQLFWRGSLSYYGHVRRIHLLISNTCVTEDLGCESQRRDTANTSFMYMYYICMQIKEPYMHLLINCPCCNQLNDECHGPQQYGRMNGLTKLIQIMVIEWAFNGFFHQ